MLGELRRPAEGGNRLECAEKRRVRLRDGAANSDAIGAEVFGHAVDDVNEGGVDVGRWSGGVEQGEDGDEGRRSGKIGRGEVGEAVDFVADEVDVVAGAEAHEGEERTGWVGTTKRVLCE